MLIIAIHSKVEQQVNNMNNICGVASATVCVWSEAVCTHDLHFQQGDPLSMLGPSTHLAQPQYGLGYFIQHHW